MSNQPPNQINTSGGAYVEGSASAGRDFVGRDQIIVQSGARLLLTIDGQPVQIPSHEELLTYCERVQAAFVRWADRPAAPEEPLYDQAGQAQAAGVPLRQQPDLYVETAARPLPMRVSAFRPQMVGGVADGEAPAQDLLAVLQASQRAVILGEPGSGKSTALERLAWLLATHTLQQKGADLADDAHPEPAELILPLLVRLAEYRGAPDLLALLTRAFNRLGQLDLNEASVRQLLRAANVQVLLLLDGLNEFDLAHAERGPRLVRDHAERFPHHAIYLTCRTADFDLDAHADPYLQVLPDAPLWQV
ncbi:MAG: NACHT domain-containing protein [Caldilineaceae bacterium]